MASRSISRRSRGFTLMEALIVLGLFGILFAFLVPVGFETLRSAGVHDARSALLASLADARTQAFVDRYGTNVGVCIDARTIVHFHGVSYRDGSVDGDIPLDSSARITSTDNFFDCTVGTGVIFTALSATTSTTDTIMVVSEDAPTTTVAVNHEGAILW